MFHVSLLKKKTGEAKRVITNLPKVGKEGQFLFQPKLILERRMIKRGNKAVPQMLVQWKSSVSEEATWEDDVMIDS
uniref:Chromo domain-containing protein n=1 Tax=Tanacetum cinerariifolium TaxID=118510 RepID=A0A699TVM7_TANCI|nr:hypothetical protein [Tanacetum cinerariifolium]